MSETLRLEMEERTVCSSICLMLRIEFILYMYPSPIDYYRIWTVYSRLVVPKLPGLPIDLL